MEEKNKFLEFMNKVLEDKLALYHLERNEKLGIKISIYDIFESNRKLDDIYSEVKRYLKGEELDLLVPDIENFYKTLKK